jgi:hypothetical protein
MSISGKSATLKGLVRKLLLKVHPDVVASISDSARSHNERALKLLLAHLESPTGLSQTVSFYLKEGGQTKSVNLDTRNPERALRQLLNLPDFEQDRDFFGTTETGWGQKRAKKATWQSEGPSKEEREELARLFKESLERWWTIRDFILTDLDLLFEQNRVRYIADALDASAKLDADMEEVELTRAVDLARQTFEFHVEDTTLRALQLPQLMPLSFVVVGRNMSELEFKNKRTLFIPLRTSPEIFGEAIDRVVESIVYRALADRPNQTEQRTRP